MENQILSYIAQGRFHGLFSHFIKDEVLHLWDRETDAVLSTAGMTVEQVMDWIDDALFTAVSKYA